MDHIMITGIGTCNAIGHSVSEFWDNLLAGRSGARELTRLDVSEHANKHGCEIEELPVVRASLDGLQAGRATRIAWPAVEEAVLDAGFRLEELAGLRVGLCVGTTMGEIDALEAMLERPGDARAAGPHAIAANLRRGLGLSGPVWTITNACAAGNLAIARAMDELQAGRADVMIACGVDALSWVAFTGFSSLRAMSPDRCRPFDRDRKGLLLGEGGGVLILERRDHLMRRGGSARARLLGYGMNSDAHHITQPDPKASGAIRAMEQALRMAGVAKEAVGYVSAHGTGTMANDRMEATAVTAVFGERKRDVPVSSIKGHLGHTLGAASLIEAVACVKALESGRLPQTLNLAHQDPLCDIRVIAGAPLEKQVDVVLSNAYAFGGINSTIVLGRADL